MIIIIGIIWIKRLGGEGGEEVCNEKDITCGIPSKTKTSAMHQRSSCILGAICNYVALSFKIILRNKQKICLDLTQN